MSNPTNRRRFLAGVAAVPAAFALPAMAVASVKDADLAKAYAEFIACDREFHFDPAGAEQEEEEREAFYQNWCDLMDRVLYADVNSPNSLIIVSLMGIRVSDLLTDSLDILESWDGYSKPRDLEDDRIATAFWRIAEYGRRLGGHVEPVGGAA